ncbi:MAG: hypothetical protein C5B50_15425 [Verrucomicrobia bacterium]|nr:MAG: hypothetical protein C5B50_15425 [Verrucomicrobiota bacterium]
MKNESGGMQGAPNAAHLRLTTAWAFCSARSKAPDDWRTPRRFATYEAIGARRIPARSFGLGARASCPRERPV